MSLCPSDQWHSVFSDGPEEMHSSSNSSSWQGRASVQVFPVFWPRCCLVPLISSLARHCSILKFTTVYPVMRQSTCVIMSDNVLLLSVCVCVLSQQHLIKRHGVVRRNQSWKTRRKKNTVTASGCGCACVDVYACARIRLLSRIPGSFISRLRWRLIYLPIKNCSIIKY